MSVVQNTHEPPAAAAAAPPGRPPLLERLPWIGRMARTPRGRQAISGGTWTVFGYGASQLLRLASKLILAKYLLPPAVFGIVGLVDVLLTGLQMLSDLGVGTNIVQHADGEERRFLDTAFTIQAMRGVGLWVLAAALAYPFASFYHDPRLGTSVPALCGLVVAAASSVAIRGFASARLWVMTRNVRLRAPVMLTTASEAVGLVVSVGWALVSPSPWALVAGTIGASLVYAAGSHIVAGPRPKFELDRDAVRTILHFGGWMFLSTATYFAGGQAERLVLGDPKVMSPEDLGCFSIALMIATAPSLGLSQVFGQVFFPIISRVRRENPDRTALQYRRVRWLALACAAVVGVVFIALGPAMIHAWLPERYGPAGWMLQALGARAAFEIATGPTSYMLFACGVSKYSAVGNCVRIALLVPSLWYTLGRHDIVGAVWALALCPLGVYLVILAGLHRCVHGVLRTEIVTTIILIAVCVAAAWAVGVGG